MKVSDSGGTGTGSTAADVARPGFRGISDLGAIGFALAGFTSWVLTDTFVKLVGQSGLPAYEVVAFLGLFMAMFLGVYAAVRRELPILWPKRVGLQVVRGCIDMANNLCVVIALRHLSLTLFYILIFTTPMATALLSAWLLGEGLSWRRAVAILVGFAGVVIAVHPFGSGQFGKPGAADWIGVGACSVCVACFAVNLVWSRVLTRTETPESLAFFSGIVTAGLGFGLMLFHAAPVGELFTGRLAAYLSGMGLFCALGTLCFYTAVKHTSAANVSQYHYTQLITGALVSYWVWHTVPGMFVVLGGVLICGSGVYIALGARRVAALTEGAG